MDSNNLFEKAVRRYDQARDLLGELGAHVLKQNSKFKIKDIFCEFDILLQYVLLKVALADGEFLPIEGEFIDKITDSYDVLSLFSDNDTNMNWAWVGANLQLRHIEYVVRKVEKLAAKYIADFAQFFAVADAEIPNRDYESQLVSCLNDIAVYFVMCDGKSDKMEIVAIVEVVRQCLVNPLLAYKSQLLQHSLH